MTTERIAELLSGAEMTTDEATEIHCFGASEHVAMRASVGDDYQQIIRRAEHIWRSGISGSVRELRDANEAALDFDGASKQRHWAESAAEYNRLNSNR